MKMEGPIYSKTHLLILVLTALMATLPPSTAAGKERCHPDDKKALLRIKQQSFAGAIAIIPAVDTWTQTSDCCDHWAAVKCDNTTNRVAGLLVLFTTYEGTPFPSAVGDLPFLRVLIFRNKAPGPFPSSLAALTNLHYLDVSDNRFTGPIPSFLATLTHLNRIDLSNNLLSGPIPPSLASLPKLTILYLYSNRLSGEIPSSFASFKSNSTMMDVLLNDNRLSGEVPASFRSAMFNRLGLSGNKLTGDPSLLLGKDKTALYGLNLADNRFSFDLSRVEFPVNMNSLDLSRNRIWGRLPEQLGHLDNLLGFNVSYNRLCGRIPTGGTLGMFDETTYFHNKCLCGTPLPACKKLL